MSTETTDNSVEIVVATARKHASIAALVMALCFCVHAVNGTFIERRFLGFEKYTDYADVDKLGHALGSWPWLASGTAHLITGVAVVVLGTNLARIVGPTSRTLAEYLRYATLVAAVGFTMLGVADVQGSETMHLIIDQNPELRREAYLVLGLVVPVANGIAIMGLGWVILLFSRYARRDGTGFATWYVVLSYIAGVSGLVLGFAYIPAYLFLFLGWLASTAILLRPGRDVASATA